MAKKYKKNQTKAVAEVHVGDHIETDNGEELVIDEVLDAETFVAHEAPAERVWMVHDAARQMVVGYQEHWWPSIRKMADAHALGETAPESACRDCFTQWGAKLK